MIFCRLDEERGGVGAPPPPRARGFGATRASCTAPVPAPVAVRWRVVSSVVSSLRGGSSDGSLDVGAAQQHGGAARGACSCERGGRLPISEPIASTEAGSMEKQRLASDRRHLRQTAPRSRTMKLVLLVAAPRLSLSHLHSVRRASRAIPPRQQMRRVAVALLSTVSTAALPCADPYAVPQPCRTYGLRVPASCVPYVPEAQGSWCATVRTPYAYQPWACRTYCVPWQHRPCVRSTCTRTR
eukprot:scaffold47422_cov30-Phaeocystis_antarctica.AAC.3